MITTTISRAVLTSGSAHDDVHALGRELAAAGFENSVSRGENPFGLVDETILSAAAAYRHANGLPEEDAIPGVPDQERRNWIGPVLWDAIAGPSDAETDEQREQRERAEAEAAERAEVEADVRKRVEAELAERRERERGGSW